MSKNIYELIKTAAFVHEPGTDIVSIVIYCGDVKSADDLQSHFAEMVEEGKLIEFHIHPPGKEGKA